ncbi:serine hydrolase domain-containing protein [Pseudotamlana agarivorans]|uniref:serine hydrolase domain-containing protein n=1 Tax=Pseudotamlana agarivorans TaxID=481183 RepID=UPI0008346F52|nr:serine hydrolase domain-containing protein [Tamlana agarivorans]
MKQLSQLFVLIFVFQSAVAQVTPSNHQKLDKIAHRLYAEGKIHGGILIAEGENVIYQNAFGMADRNLEIPNTTKTRFVINSMGKMFTAILTLQLVEEDSIALDDPISKHLSWFKHPEADDITIHHLLSHRSGLKGYFDEQIKGNIDFFIPQREVLDKIAQLELNFDPGQGFDYSNTGYLLLGEIIMKYRNADYYNVQKNRIFTPIGMTSSYNSTSIYGPGSPVYYLQDGSPATPFPHSNYRGDGGTKSTLQDLHIFMVAVGSDKLLKKESWDLMFQKYSLPEEAKRPFGAHFEPYGYGCSVMNLPYKGENKALAIGHGGAGYGSSNYMLKFIDSERIIIQWNNEFLRPLPPELLEEIAKL